MSDQSGNCTGQHKICLEDVQLLFHVLDGVIYNTTLCVAEQNIQLVRNSCKVPEMLSADNIVNPALAIHDTNFASVVVLNLWIKQLATLLSQFNHHGNNLGITS